jgi:hypothetical protein
VIARSYPNNNCTNTDAYTKADGDRAERISLNAGTGLIKQILCSLAPTLQGTPGGSHSVLYHVFNLFHDPSGFNADMRHLRSGRCTHFEHSTPAVLSLRNTRAKSLPEGPTNTKGFPIR